LDDVARASSRPEWLRRLDEGNDFNRGSNTTRNLAGLADNEAGLSTQATVRVLDNGSIVTVSGVADRAFEIPQALRAGEHLGGGSFRFREGSSVGIDGDFFPIGSTESIPVSLKSLDSADSVQNIFRTIRKNAKQIAKFNAAEPGTSVVVGRPYQFTTEEITTFISNSKPNVLPPSDVFRQTILDTRNGTVIIDSSGKVTVRKY
jgi:hypothetical protein